MCDTTLLHSFGVATLKFLKIIGFYAQLYIELVTSTTLHFKLTSQNMRFSLFQTKKKIFKDNLNIFLTFMIFNFLVWMLDSTETLILDFFVHENI